MNARAQLWFLNRWLDHLPCLHINDAGKSRFIFHQFAKGHIQALCPHCQELLTEKETAELFALLKDEKP